MLFLQRDSHAVTRDRYISRRFHAEVNASVLVRLCIMFYVFMAHSLLLVSDFGVGENSTRVNRIETRKKNIFIQHTYGYNFTTLAVMQVATGILKTIRLTQRC